MQRITVYLLILFLTISCKKENSLFTWEKSFGNGTAYFISSASDSGIVACGQKNSSPFLVSLSSDKSVRLDYSFPGNGLFNSAWGDTSGFIAAGSSNGKMLIARISMTGETIWDTTISAGFNVDFTRLCYSGSGNFVAVGTASADSAASGSSGLLFIRFDTTGVISGKNEVFEDWFIAAGDIALDGSGNIFLPVTATSSSMKPRAGVAKYSPSFEKIWQTDLYNNNSYSSAANGILYDTGGNLYVTGKTEVEQVDGILENSFIASVTTAGIINWKKYLEIYNSGTSLKINDTGIMMLLNRNCFVTDLISDFTSENGCTVDGLLRLFNACDSKDTDALGSAFDIDNEGNIIAAGSLGGNFYLAVKSTSQ